MSDYSRYPDQKLVRLAQDGNTSAFGELVMRHEDKMFRLARRMTATKEDSEDVVQEAFTRAFSSIRSFKGRSKFTTWLYRIVANLALMKKRDRMNMMESLDAPIQTESGGMAREVRSAGADPLGLLIVKESSEIVARAMEDMRPSNRDVLVLRHFEGLTAKQIGRLLNMSPSAVKSRNHRARLRLKERVTALAQEGTGSSAVSPRGLAQQHVEAVQAIGGASTF